MPLPAIYKGVVNPSYFQDFNGRYDLTLISKPTGAADPTYEETNLRTFTNTSTVISNMNMQGEYVFKIKAVPNSGGVDAAFIEKEYACSGTALESTFSIFVSTQVNANAGSDQNITGTSVILNGNNPGVESSGQWTLISKPSGTPDPVIANPHQFNTKVMGMSKSGIYKFLWTITTGNCTSSDEMEINVSQNNEICAKPVNGTPFSWAYNTSGSPYAADNTQVEQTFTQPSSNYGYTLNIYTLDNSFNMKINGTPLTNQEIQFQASHTQNIRFKADGALWGSGGIPQIYAMSGTDLSPIIKVVISPSGGVSFLGKRSNTSPLEELELIGSHTVNTITWNNNSNNTIIVGQTVDGATTMAGSGYGLDITDCFCYKPGITSGTALDTKVGITSLTRAGADHPDNWPMVRKGGWIALESKTKAFVPNRVAFDSSGNPVGIAPANFVEGMMVYDTSNKRLKLYTSTDGGNSYAWYCVSNQSCPETSKTFALDCSNASVTGDTFLDPNVNFTITLPYLDGDGSSYAQQLIPSTGTTGLTAILSAGTLANGSGNLALTVSGPSTRDNGGTYYFEVSINGKKTYMPQKRLFLLKWPLSYI